MATYHRLSSSPRPSTSSLRALELSPPSSPPTRAHRSKTLSSLNGFDFALDSLVIPLSLSREDGGNDGTGEGGEAEKHVGLINGIALVVGLQVGSGIFSSPGVVLASVGSSGAALVVWVLSGFLAWSGASSFAELGSAIPLNGGAQAYLAYSYGPLVSYLFSWTAVSLLKPGSSAIIALIFGEYLNRLIYHSTSSDPTNIIEIPEWSIKLTATLAILLISLVNLANARMGTGVQVVLTSIKLCSLLFVVGLGLVSLIRHGPGDSLRLDTLFEGSSSNPGSYAIAFYSGLWAFDGWDQSNYVAGEMINTTRDLPRVIHTSMAIVTVLFTMANVAYFVVLDEATVARSNTVALDFGSALLGPAGGITFSLLVAISCIGALNGSFYTSARLIYAAAKERTLPALFGRLHPVRKTPVNAMGLQAGLTIVFTIFGGGFRSLVNLFSVANWLFYLLTVMGLLILRVKEPYLERPYKTWLITPVIFCIVALFLLLMPIIAAPFEALAAFGFILVGLPLYYITASSREPHGGPGGSSSRGRVDESSSVWERVKSGWESFVGGLGKAGRGGRSGGGGGGGGGEGRDETVEMLSSRSGGGMEMSEVR